MASPETGQQTTECIDVIPATGANVQGLQSTLVRGQNKTTNQSWQGWYSQTYSGADPAPTLVYDWQLEAGNSVLAWLLVPRDTGTTARASLQVLSTTSSTVDVHVQVGDEPPETLSI